MKVYVATKAEVFKPEIYLHVSKSKKDAEKKLRRVYPYMRPANMVVRDDNTLCFLKDARVNTPDLLFIHEEII
jgi:hypothetical protein